MSPSNGLVKASGNKELVAATKIDHGTFGLAGVHARGHVDHICHVKVSILGLPQEKVQNCHLPLLALQSQSRLSARVAQDIFIEPITMELSDDDARITFLPTLTTHAYSYG